MRFGGRSRWHELSLPREVEQPWMTLESLRLFLESDAPVALRQGRDSGVAELLRRAPHLQDALEAAQVGYAVKEGHVHHIDYPGLLATREVLLGFGRRLAASGTLAQPDEVWMLRLEELAELLTDPGAVDVAAVVATRREELERGRLEGPVPYIGEPPQEAERHAVLEKFYGRGREGSTDRLLKGTGASPGSAEGVARIVRGSDDFSRIRRGEVLVAATTTPAWTPLFPSLAAVVTETGGMLCHGAIVAREYAIPAVVGVEGATQRIADGARVRVDGENGEVALL
jgi:phosphohistidine swiveling domain-containing protein